MLKDVRNVGAKDAVIEVADGFALNSLIPQGKAVQATSDKIAQVEKRKTQDAQAHAARDHQLAETITGLDGTTITISVKANEHGHLFKAVHKDEIARLIARKAGGVTVPASALSGIEDVLKSVGMHEVRIVAAGAKALVRVVIEAQK